MKIIITYVCISIIFILSLTSCSLKNQDTNHDKDTSMLPNSSKGTKDKMEELEQKIIHEKGKKEEQILIKESVQPYWELIKKSYPEQSFFSNGILFRRYSPTSSFQQYLYIIEEDFPIECLRKIGNENAYVIYKTNEGGLIYCFYKQMYGTWTLNHSTYLKNSLSYNDFSNIKEGYSIDDVAAIDLAFKSMNTFLNRQSSSVYESIHLLKDGLLVFEYEKNDDKIIVKSQEYHSDFKYSINEIVCDYSILPQDYPK